MTSHELARRLLEEQDLPVVLNDSEYGCVEVRRAEIANTYYYKPSKDTRLPSEQVIGLCVELI